MVFCVTRIPRTRLSFSRRPSVIALRVIISVSASALIGACVSWIPVHPLTPAVAESASRYSEVMANFSDQALLANILRAKDRMPLDFNDLSSITGSFSFSDTLGFTVPFGAVTGPASQGTTTYKPSVMPSVTGTSSPTITVGTLNSQGFMMTMIQPVSTTYILSKWDSYPHDLLLYLFVKSIRFPDETTDNKSCLALDLGQCERKTVHRNSPDDPKEFANFRMLVKQMVSTMSETNPLGGDVDLKSLLLLDPLGSPVPFGQTVQATTPAPSTPAATSGNGGSSKPAPQVIVPAVPKAPSHISAAPSVDSEPALAEVPSQGSRPAATYYAYITYTTRSKKETSPSLEVAIHLGPNRRAMISVPNNVRKDAVAYNVYVGRKSDEETLQAKDLPLDGYWTEPDAGLIIGNSIRFTSHNLPFNSALPTSDAYVRLSYVTSAGESLASSEVHFDLKSDHILTVPPPPPVSTHGYQILGFNVYVSTKSGSETRQNATPVALQSPWTEPNKGFITGPLPPTAPGTQYQVTSDYNIVQTINGLTDGQLHVGNAGCPDYIKTGVRSDGNDLCPPNSDSPFVRFYKEYPAQIVLCLKTAGDGTFYGHHIAPLSEQEKEDRGGFIAAAADAKAARDKAVSESKIPMAVADTAYYKALYDAEITPSSTIEDEVEETDQHTAVFANFMAQQKTPSGSAPAAGGAPPPAGGGGGSATAAAGGGAMPTVTLALQPSRISAILHSETCETDQIVLASGTEEAFHKESMKFSHIEWRSTAEIIQYLGAIARFQDSAVAKLTTPEDTSQDRLAQLSKVAIKIGSAADEPLFTYSKFDLDDKAPGEIKVTYRGRHFRAPALPTDDNNDHTLETMALLNELISIAKISGSLPVPQPVTVLP